MKAIAYVVVVAGVDGKRVEYVASKRAAHDRGRELRAAGATVYVYATAEAIRFGLIEQAQP